MIAWSVSVAIQTDVDHLSYLFRSGCINDFHGGFGALLRLQVGTFAAQVRLAPLTTAI